MSQRSKVRQPQQKRSREKKAKIIRTARRLFARAGYDGVHTNTIAAEAGVSVGALYSYFRNKREILIEVIRALVEETAGDYEKSLEAIDTDRLPLEVFVDQSVRVLGECHRRNSRLKREVLIQALKDPEIEALYYSQDERIKNLLKKFLEKYGDRVRLDDLDAASFVILNTMDQFLRFLVIGRKGEADGRVLEELSRMVYRYLSGGGDIDRTGVRTEIDFETSCVRGA